MLRVTPQERLALQVTALLLTAGAAVRVVSTDPLPLEWQQKSGASSDTVGDTAVSVVREATRAALARERVRATPLSEGEQVDLNTASADEIDRLPGVGPALAARIIERRASHGPFRTLADLDSVPGVGPALLRNVAPHVPLADSPPGHGVAAARAAPLDLNRATAQELDALPGVGPVLARRVLEWRDARGPFRSIEELEQVPGIGPGLREKLAPLVRVGR